MQKQNDNISSKKVFVGLSGGVDSAVSAALLKKEGYDVTGVFIRVWQPDETDCGWKDERRDAMRVAAALDIPFETLDLGDVYKKEVADYMIAEYAKGRTPNPDIMCNRYVKFGSFWDYAKEKGADFVATGHYAQRIKTKDGEYQMLEGADPDKDQTYFLWTLTEKDLEHVLFPIGHLQKKEVRMLAAKFNLPVSTKKDSQGVCFIGHLDMKEFLKTYIKTEQGKVLDIEGNEIGTHEGAVLYTFGERHGFTMKNKSTDAQPRYIISKDIEKNTITVASDTEFKKVTEETDVKDVPLSRVALTTAVQTQLTQNMFYKCECRIRYRQERQLCTINSKEGVVSVVFNQVQKGLAPGQSVVFYIGNQCLGGAILDA